MEKEYLELLLKKHQEETLNRQERLDLDNWYLNRGKSSLPLEDAELYKRLLAEMDQAFPFETEKPVKKVRLWPRIAVAAAAVAAITLGTWLYYAANTVRGPEFVSGTKDIGPGKNTATLIIDNKGQMIGLSDAKAGVVIAADKLTYDDGTEINLRNTSGKQTLITPRGGTYQITLSDGTKVWLNAASVLTYHTSLKDADGVRRVKLTGEAYFEVAKDKKHPFVVENRGQEVKVLGTHFNINAYTDEELVKTTLLEGSVKVSQSAGGTWGGKRMASAILKPGEQSVTSANNRMVVKKVDAGQAIAWKNNEFMFSGESIANIMNMVGRWYDVEVYYLGSPPTEKYSGGVSRFDNISKVLEILESSGGVHFKIEGRHVYVSKQKSTN